MTDKLKVGLLDLLTILLPGAFLMAGLSKIDKLAAVYNDFFSANISQEWIRSAIYVATAYMLGHFIFFMASFLDGWIYENVQKVFWNDHRLTAYVLQLKTEKTGIEDRKIINAFKWSCAWLLMKEPVMYAEVERYIAESKFFRSLVVVSLIVFAILIKPHTGVAFVMLVVALLSLIRYITQRRKSIETAYEYMLTASDTTFNEEPREELLSILSRSNRTHLHCNKASAYEVNRLKTTVAGFLCFVRKIGEVLNLCFNPFYIKEIVPKGKPIARSKEIRWFLKDDNTVIKEWIKRHTKDGTQAEHRTDTYCIIPDRVDLSIKQRQGNLELKLLNGNAIKRQWDHNISGKSETWEKWVLHEEDANVLLSYITKKKYKKLDVTKERWSLKMTVDKHDVRSFHTTKEQLLNGCLIEYTVITINNNVCYTFGIEQYGNFELHEELIKDIVGDSILKESDSYSYSAFVHHFSDKLMELHHLRII